MRPHRTCLLALLIAAGFSSRGLAQERAFTIPLIELNDQRERQVVVDREKDQYLGHPTTLLLEDGNLLLAASARERVAGPLAGARG